MRARETRSSTAPEPWALLLPRSLVCDTARASLRGGDAGGGFSSGPQALGCQRHPQGGDKGCRRQLRVAERSAATANAKAKGISRNNKARAHLPERRRNVMQREG